MRKWDGLEEVVAIADSGTFVGGARILGVSPSHISRTIAQLEERLGAQLFHRTTRKVTLTDTGRSVVEQSRRIIQEREDLFALTAGMTEPQGELRLTCSITLGERFVAPLVRDFAQRHQKISIHLDLTNRLIDLVGEGYDLAIRTGANADSRLTGRRIATRPVETCASPEYLAKAGSPTRIEDLSEHECLTGSSTEWHFLDQGQVRTIAPKGRWHCNSGIAIADAAVAGMGVCQLPIFYVGDHLAHRRLVPVLTAFRVNTEPVFALYPAKRHLLPRIRHLVDFLESELQSVLDAAGKQ